MSDNLRGELRYCPRCGSRRWITERYVATTGIFYMRCEDCKYGKEKEQGD